MSKKTSASRQVLAGAAGALFSGVVSTAVGGFNPFPTDHLADALVQHSISSTAGTAVRMAIQSAGDSTPGTPTSSSNSASAAGKVPRSTDDAPQPLAGPHYPNQLSTVDLATGNATLGKADGDASDEGLPEAPRSRLAPALPRIMPADAKGAAALLALDPASGGLGLSAALAEWILSKGDRMTTALSTKLCEQLVNAITDPARTPSWRNVVGVVEALGRVAAYVPTFEILRKLWDTEVRAAERALAFYADGSEPVDPDDVAVQIECYMFLSVKLAGRCGSAVKCTDYDPGSATGVGNRPGL
ncbi:hypothetical protein HK405_007405 [Cladochytrium tenue]|nr:hypothetical protein HK405_007405 [Cladochytrium tenue]